MSLWFDQTISCQPQANKHKWRSNETCSAKPNRARPNPRLAEYLLGDFTRL